MRCLGKHSVIHTKKIDIPDNDQQFLKTVSNRFCSIVVIDINITSSDGHIEDILFKAVVYLCIYIS